ncbi:MAG: hypothetical protein JO354_04020 [Verrucomicrobia bacterium]|nr:hypothetical protein [Verrucomicrobiota bacterium]
MQRVHHSAVLWSASVIVVRTAGLICILPVVLRVLAPPDVGLWYVYLGIAQVATIFEFGFSPVIGRRASYYLAGADTVPALGLGEGVSGAQPNFDAISGLIRMSQGLYRIIALAATACLIFGGGTWLLLKYPAAFTRPTALIAYAILICATAANMLSYFWGALLFGLNQVRLQQKFLLQALVLNYSVVLLGLSAGLGLIALASGQLILGVYPRIREKRAILQLVSGPHISRAKAHWRDLWPMTWRSGLGSIASYLSLPATTLVCAQLFDLTTAGSYGVSLQIGLMISLLAGTWQSVTYPRLSALRASASLREARQLVAQRMALGLATYVALAACAFIIAPQLLHLIKSRTTLLSRPYFALLLVACAVDFIVGSHAAVLQTANYTPYLKAFIATAAASVLAGIVLGRLFGVGGLIAAPIAVQLSFNAWHTPQLCWRSLKPVPVV